MDNGLRRRKEATDVSGISREHHTTTRRGSDSKSRNEDPGFIQQLLSGRFTMRTLISSGSGGQIQDTEEDIDKVIDATMWEENERR